MEGRIPSLWINVMNYHIPEEEVENLLSVYWQLLGEVETNTNPDKDILNKYLVEGAYRVLNRAGILRNAKPRWLK